jgi:CRP-like cAMP-binding protein
MEAPAYAWLAEHTAVHSFGRSEILFLEGEQPARLWIVTSGAVKVFRSLESGRELILGLFRFGDAIGEVAVLDATGYPASACAHEPCTMVSMSARDYFEYFRRFDGAALALVRDLSIRMRTMQQRMKDLGGGGVEFRLARVIRALAAVHAEDPPVLPATVTRQDLADMVGARVETVIRVMSRWLKEGVLAQERGGLRILDDRALESLAEEL